MKSWVMREDIWNLKLFNDVLVQDRESLRKKESRGEGSLGRRREVGKRGRGDKTSLGRNWDRSLLWEWN